MKIFVVFLLLSLTVVSVAQYGRGGYNDGGHHGDRYPSKSSSSSSSSSGSCENGGDGGGGGEGFECNRCSDISLITGADPDVKATLNDEFFDKNGCKITEIKCDFSGSTIKKGYMIFNDDVSTVVNPNMAEQVIEQKLTCSKSGSWSFMNAASATKVACKAAQCDQCSVKSRFPEDPIQPIVKFSGLNANLCRIGTVTCKDSVRRSTIKFLGGSSVACGNECIAKNEEVVSFFCNKNPLQVVAKTDKGDFAADTAECKDIAPVRF